MHSKLSFAVVEIKVVSFFPGVFWFFMGNITEHRAWSVRCMQSKIKCIKTKQRMEMDESLDGKKVDQLKSGLSVLKHAPSVWQTDAYILQLEYDPFCWCYSNWICNFLDFHGKNEIIKRLLSMVWFKLWKQSSQCNRYTQHCVWKKNYRKRLVGQSSRFPFCCTGLRGYWQRGEKSTWTLYYNHYTIGKSIPMFRLKIKCYFIFQTRAPSIEIDILLDFLMKR